MDEKLMDVAVVDDGAFIALRSVFGGDLLRAPIDGYDAARRVWNGNVDRRPALIARCRGVADVQRRSPSPASTAWCCRCAAAGTARRATAPTTAAWSSTSRR